MKNSRVFLSENFQFLEVKFSIYLNLRVFVMQTTTLVNVPMTMIIRTPTAIPQKTKTKKKSPQRSLTQV